MPWKTSDVAGKTKKAKSSRKQRQWVHVANQLLAHGASDKQAIIQANGVVKNTR